MHSCIFNSTREHGKTVAKGVMVIALGLKLGICNNGREQYINYTLRLEADCLNPLCPCDITGHHSKVLVPVLFLRVLLSLRARIVVQGTNQVGTYL